MSNLNNPNLYPVPPSPDQWAGYAGPVTIGNAEYGVHRLGTALASVGATTAVTLGYMVAGAESPMLNVNPTINETSRVVVERTVDTTHHDAEPLWMKSEQNGTKFVPRDETQELRNFSWMSDVVSAGSPVTILNPGGLNTFVMDIKQSQEQGWTVTSVESKGTSSDEWRASSGAGLGKLDAGNQKAAEQYLKTGDQQLKKELAADGVVLPGATFTSSSQEVVLGQGLRAYFDQKVGKLGFANAAEFIQAYKASPNGLSPEAHEIAAAFLERNRGTWHTAHLTRTTTAEVPAYEETRATRCVDETITRLKTEERTTRYGGNLPLFFVPFPVIRRRRKDAFLTDWDVDGEVDVKGAHTNEVKTNPDGSMYIEGGLPVWSTRVGKAKLPRESRLPREARPQTPRSRQKEQPVNPYLLPFEERVAYMAARRRAEIKGAVIFGISAAAVLSCLRLDAGYCPDPENWQNQNWSISHPVPDSLHVGLGLPFFIPGPETGKFEILPPVCPEEDRSEPYSSSNSGGNSAAPTCDTRKTTITNGQVTKLDETHYPGAVTITKTTR